MATNDTAPEIGSIGQAMSIAAHNAAMEQQQGAITLEAATTSGVATLLSIDTASTGLATKKIFGK